MPICEQPGIWRANGFPAAADQPRVLLLERAGHHHCGPPDDTSLVGQPGFGIVGMIVASIMTGGSFFVVHPNESRVLIFSVVSGQRPGQRFLVDYNPFTVKKRLHLRCTTSTARNQRITMLRATPSRSPRSSSGGGRSPRRCSTGELRSSWLFRAKPPFAVWPARIRWLTATRKEINHYGAARRPRWREQSAQVQNRLKLPGVEVLDACISHLAYAQEIAQAMLRRQQVRYHRRPPEKSWRVRE